jgi:methylthioribose-1-phosphate isomerase
MWHTLKYHGGALSLLNQLLLPEREEYVLCRTVEEVCLCIRTMVVRGAPAIGVTAAYGVVLGAREGIPEERVFGSLAATRPTAVNLFWALDRMRRVWRGSGGDPAALEAEARAIEAEDQAACRSIGRHGAELLRGRRTLMTLCNAGALATAGTGTALGVVRACFERDPGVSVYALETRPYLQGARLTAWELQRDGIPVTLLTDNMAGWALRDLGVEAVVVGADRIAANGDTANKIGTYQLAVLARHHGVPFYVAAPTSTLDLSLPDGSAIPIEERPSDEVTLLGGRRLAPAGVPARHPAFDVTPFGLIDAIVTEQGLFDPHGHPRD